MEPQEGGFGEVGIDFSGGLTEKGSLVTGWQLERGMSKGRHFLRWGVKRMCVGKEVKDREQGCMMGRAGQVLEVTGMMDWQGLRPALCPGCQRYCDTGFLKEDSPPVFLYAPYLRTELRDA